MIRVAQGVDIHPFAEARPLVLGGHMVSERGGLAGHSDADAVLHALTDALLGVAAAGDIGSHFPSDDERWKDASSDRFVHEAMRQLKAVGGSVQFVDVTIIAEVPRLAPHRDQIRESVARTVGVGEEQVSVKATTTDHLGFIGRREGICAMVIVTAEVDG